MVKEQVSGLTQDLVSRYGSDKDQEQDKTCVRSKDQVQRCVWPKDQVQYMGLTEGSGARQDMDLI